MMSYWISMLGGQVSYWDVGGVRTRVLEAGDSSRNLILCIHGSGGHAENFVTNVLPLSEAGHVVAPDLLGHGMNSRPKGADYTIRGVLEHLKDVIQKTAATRVSLMGLSLGGVLAAHLARELRDNVDRLVMICPSGLAPGTRDHDALVEGATRMMKGTQAAIESPSLENCRLRVEHLVSDPARIPEEMIYLRQYMYTRPGAETMISILQSNADHIDDYILGDEALRDLDMPVLIAWGRHNSGSVELAERATKTLKKGNLAIFEDSGHWPHVEEQEEFHKSVLQFLR